MAIADVDHHRVTDISFVEDLQQASIVAVDVAKDECGALHIVRISVGCGSGIFATKWQNSQPVSFGSVYMRLDALPGYYRDVGESKAPSQRDDSNAMASLTDGLNRL